MNHSMINSASSLSALQKRLDILSHNISNISTVGYKRTDASFQDILATMKQQERTMELPGRLTPLGLSEGWGARLMHQFVDLTQGSLKQTDQPLDLAIEGDALFELNVPRFDETGAQLFNDAGEPIVDRTWTRVGEFQLTPMPGDEDNVYLATKDGTVLFDVTGAEIAIPRDHRIVIDEHGVITSYGPDNVPEEIGQLRIVKVLNPQLLVPIGNHRFALGEGIDVNSALRELATPEEVALEGIAIRQGFLEQSNVDLTQEMTEVLMIQRAFQLNSRALTSADTMMSLANNLRG